MSKEIKSPGVTIRSDRAQSASLKKRPFSAVLSRRLSSIQNVYNPSQPKSIILQQLPIKGTPDRSKKKSKNRTQNEDMIQEILGLKLKINQLSKQVVQQRGKAESIRQKRNKVQKVLKVKFQNESLWNAGVVSHHKVEGIRSMYDSLKKQHEELKKQHKKLNQKTQVTNILESETYISILQAQLKKQKFRLDLIEKNYCTINLNGSNVQLINKLSFSALQIQHDVLLEKHDRLRAKYKMMKDILFDKQNKIRFLEDYIKELSNKNSMLRKEASNLRKNNEKIEEARIQAQLQQESANRKQVEQIDQLAQQIQEIKEKSMQEKSNIVAQKQQKIALLSRENHYYQEMVRELRQTNSQITSQIHQLTKNKANQNILKRLEEVSSQQRQSQNLVAEQKNNIHQKQEHQVQKKIFQGNFVKRQRKTADRKWNQAASKKRKVKINEVDEIIELLRLQIIGKSIPYKQISQILAFSPTQQMTEEQKAWYSEYISMKQVNFILQTPPLSLSREKAFLLSRYIIEDSQQQFVFVDEDNENFRNIVQSIFRHILGNYTLLESSSQLKEQLSVFLQKYSNNLMALLKGINPKGQISKTKFIHAVKNLSAECSEELIDILLGCMSLEADSLANLNFFAIFDKYKQ